MMLPGIMYKVISDALDEAQFDKLLRMATDAKFIKARIGTSQLTTLSSQVRRCRLCRVQDTDLDKHLISIFNELSPKYSCSRLEKQIIKYTDRDLGFYNWHQDHDTNFRPPRYLSLSLIINQNCTGGDFKLKVNGDEIFIPGIKNTAIIFYSDLEHCVTPVTTGERTVLVAWYHIDQNEENNVIR